MSKRKTSPIFELRFVLWVVVKTRKRCAESWRRPRNEHVQVHVRANGVSTVSWRWPTCCGDKAKRGRESTGCTTCGSFVLVGREPGLSTCAGIRTRAQANVNPPTLESRRRSFPEILCHWFLAVMTAMVTLTVVLAVAWMMRGCLEQLILRAVGKRNGRQPADTPRRAPTCCHVHWRPPA